MTSPQPAIIFDLDGTLVDSSPAIHATLRHIQTIHRLEVDPADDLRWALGPPLADVMQRLIGGADPARISAAVSAYRAHHAGVCVSHASVYPGIEEALARLSAEGCPLFVGTSKLAAVATRVLGAFGLTPFFRSIYGSDADGRLAPKAALVHHILDAERMTADAAIMIGDRDHDVIGAHANGVRCIGVAWGYGTREELEAAGADAICDRPPDLPSACRRLLHDQ